MHAPTRKRVISTSGRPPSPSGSGHYVCIAACPRASGHSCSSGSRSLSGVNVQDQDQSWLNLATARATTAGTRSPHPAPTPRADLLSPNSVAPHSAVAGSTAAVRIAVPGGFPFDIGGSGRSLTLVPPSAGGSSLRGLRKIADWTRLAFRMPHSGLRVCRAMGGLQDLPEWTAMVAHDCRPSMGFCDALRSAVGQCPPRRVLSPDEARFTLPP
ncbi:hypothetical protein C2E23DRAFT_224705 [Lenzites betulinus]|nr:hypothetical protein C2E23DRAFT_224705 [Lenzites betulinus]